MSTKDDDDRIHRLFKGFTVRPGDKLADVERKMIESALRTQPTKQDAADSLGISLRTLYNRIEQYK